MSIDEECEVRWQLSVDLATIAETWLRDTADSDDTTMIVRGDIVDVMGNSWNGDSPGKTDGRTGRRMKPMWCKQERHVGGGKYAVDECCRCENAIVDGVAHAMRSSVENNKFGSADRRKERDEAGRYIFDSRPAANSKNTVQYRQPQLQAPVTELGKSVTNLPLAEEADPHAIEVVSRRLKSLVAALHGYHHAGRPLASIGVVGGDSTIYKGGYKCFLCVGKAFSIAKQTRAALNLPTPFASTTKDDSIRLVQRLTLEHHALQEELEEDPHELQNKLGHEYRAHFVQHGDLGDEGWAN